MEVGLRDEEVPARGARGEEGFGGGEDLGVGLELGGVRREGEAGFGKGVSTRGGLPDADRELGDNWQGRDILSGGKEDEW